MTEIYIVCDSDHGNDAVFHDYEKADAYTAKHANRRGYFRDGDGAEGPEVALWIREGHGVNSGRVFGHMAPSILL